MAQKRRRKNRKKLFLILFLTLLVMAGVVGYFVWDGYFRAEEKEDESSEMIEEVVPEEDKGGKGSTGDMIVEEKEPVVQYDGEDPNELDELTGVITYADVVGEKLMIRVNIDQFLEGGSCELSLIQGGVKYSASANINSVTTATCEGFDVLVNELGKGNYQIMIKLNAGGKTGTINGEVSI